MASRALNDPAEIPAELDRWNWGAFFLNWIWGIGNSTFIALLALIPGVNIVVMIVLGARGSRWAWRNRAWRDAEHFRKTQRAWAIAGPIVWGVVIALVAVPVISVPLAMKRSDAYRMALEAVRADEHVRAELGEDISPGFWTSGGINVQGGGTGAAQISFSLTGSKGSGSATVQAIRTAGIWDMRLLVVGIDGSDAPIVLVNKDNVPIPGARLDL